MERIHKNSLIIIAIIILVIFWFMHSNNEDFNEESPIDCTQCSSCMPDFNDYMKKEECLWYKDYKPNEVCNLFSGSQEDCENNSYQNCIWNGEKCFLKPEPFYSDDEDPKGKIGFINFKNGVDCDTYPVGGCGENYEWNGCKCASIPTKTPISTTIPSTTTPIPPVEEVIEDEEYIDCAKYAEGECNGKCVWTEDKCILNCDINEVM